MARLNKKRCTVIAGAILIAGVVSALTGAAHADTAKRPTPRKDQEIADLLQTGKKDDAFMRELVQMDRRRLTGALAWELTRPELRTPALRFLSRKGRYRELTPYVIVALKWGGGADRLTAVYVVMRYRAKEAIPVILSHILDDPYKEVRHIRRDDTGKIYRSEITADLCRSASITLAMLTDGKIGLKPRPGEPPPIRMGAAWPPVPNEQKREWRAWWKKNGKNLLPQVAMPQARFQTEKQVRQWCQARIGFFGEEMAKAARKDVDAFLRAVSPLCKAGGDLFGVSIPRTVVGPLRTAVLAQAVLQTSAKGAKPTGTGGPGHRLALLALSRSVDYPEITSLLLWAHKNGRLLDAQAGAYCLGKMRDPRTVGLLEKILNEKPDRATRFDVARALGKTDQPAAAKLLVQVLATDKSDRFSSTIYEALRGLAGRGPAQEKGVVEAVCPLLEDPDAKVVKLALGVLANTSSTAALAAVEKAMPKLDGELKIRAGKAVNLIRNNIARRRPTH